MSETIAIAILSLVGTLSGTFGGIMTANKLTGYRLEQLEKKVEKHNNLIDRMYRVEERTELQEQRLDTMERSLHEITR